jgi:hypothetical protein
MRHGSSRWNVDFRCLHCGYHVSVNSILSGVVNRNHCPYCLWSRHLDLLAAGDRLSACKAPMRPLGITLKKSHKKYNRAGSGELMLVHICIDCDKVAINRIAADDDVEMLLEVFEGSLELGWRIHSGLARSGILLLGADDYDLLRAGLVGRRSPSGNRLEALQLESAD